MLQYPTRIFGTFPLNAVFFFFLPISSPSQYCLLQVMDQILYMKREGGEDRKLSQQFLLRLYVILFWTRWFFISVFVINICFKRDFNIAYLFSLSTCIFLPAPKKFVCYTEGVVKIKIFRFMILSFCCITKCPFDWQRQTEKG